MRFEVIKNSVSEYDDEADFFLDNFKSDKEYVYDIYYSKEHKGVIAEIWNDDEDEENIIFSQTDKKSEFAITPEPYKGGNYESFLRFNGVKEEVDTRPLNERFCDITDEVWQKDIKEVWRSLCFKGEEDPRNEQFLEAIWHASTEILPKLEVSIIVDRDGKLFINRGSPGYVDYKGVDLKGMTIPLQSWIHTHPFGYAFWSGTDTNTINNWKMVLNEATVLGNGERLTWVKNNGSETMIKTVTQAGGFDL